ncbi:serine/threonine-protein kinase [Merismopedia glauca]|nr:serine/threonine-protein kinase [Merismopedia glauca]
MIGQLLGGHYQIIRPLGRGGLAETFLAIDLHLPDRPHRVVKELKPQSSHPLVLETAKILFEREAQVLYKLGIHNQIPALYAHFEEEDRFFLVEEFVPGHDLSEELIPGKQLSENEVIDLVRDLLEALAFVHQNHVIHRDIKPSNLIRRETDGKIVLIDFGAVKQVSTQVLNTQGQVSTTIVVGTPNYMPGEQQHGNPQFSSDIFAVGIVAIQALTGVPPAQLPVDSNTLEIIWRDRTSASPRLANILDKMVRYDFRQRYSSAVEALEAVNELRKPLGRTIPYFKGSGGKPVPKTLWWTILGGGVGAIVLGLLVSQLIFKPHLQSIPYQNSQLGIELQRPETWDFKDTSSIIHGKSVEFTPPITDNSGNTQTKLTLTKEELTSNQDLAEYTEALKKEIINNNSQSQIVSEGQYILAGKTGYRLIYTHTQDGKELKCMQVWFLDNFQVYSFNYQAEVGKFDKDLDIVEEMIKSLKLTQS